MNRQQQQKQAEVLIKELKEFLNQSYVDAVLEDDNHNLWYIYNNASELLNDLKIEYNIFDEE